MVLRKFKTWLLISWLLIFHVLAKPHGPSLKTLVRVGNVHGGGRNALTNCSTGRSAPQSVGNTSTGS
jgi:hypothetical protein